MAVNENPHGLWNSRRLGELPRGDQGTGVPRLSHRPDGPQVILSLAVDLGEQGLRVCCAELRSLDSLIVRLSERTEAHWKLRLVDLHWPQAIVKRRRRPNCGAPYPGGLLTLILFGDSEPAGGGATNLFASHLEVATSTALPAACRASVSCATFRAAWTSLSVPPSILTGQTEKIFLCPVSLSRCKRWIGFLERMHGETRLRRWSSLMKR